MILYTLYFILFIFGLCVGSFLNAVIWRLETGESVIFVGTKSLQKSLQKGLSPYLRMARSYCPHCLKILKWYDLAPVLSFFILRGKCRYCKKPISRQYPIIEIMTGILFLLIAIKISNFKFLILNQFQILKFKFIIDIVYWLYIASVLIIIFVYDLRHYLIPDKILFPAIAVSIMYHVLSIMQAENDASYIIHNILYNYAGSGVIASGFFLALVLFSRGKWMGMGDVKLALLMGLILGWPHISAALFFAFMFGAIVGLVLIGSGSLASFLEVKLPLRRRYSLKSQIPFGPFLIIGTFIALLWGSSIIKWYEQLFL